LKTIKFLLQNVVLVVVLLTSCKGQSSKQQANQQDQNMSTDSLSTITLGAGCFWCVEAIFQDLKGVAKVESGYAGGSVKNPTYKEVCTGNTGHAEVAKIWYDSNIITFDELLEVFWHSHDPTTLNRQGNDVGTQYRSAIFYENEEQKMLAESSKSKTDSSGLWENPIVTTLEPLSNYFPAENYHQDYFNNHTTEPYCSIVIAPKVAKFRKKFSHLLKD
jgi:peptide-methionine (S)-S-oxide reductase